MAITANFSGGILTITGDNLDNPITVSRDPGGNILVNGGAVTISGGTPTVANTTSIQTSSLDGNDTLAVDESNGALPPIVFDGGAGNDVITGSSGTDMLIGGDGNDTVTGGRGNDTALLGNGDDTFIWNPGDGSDIVEGQGGSDTLNFNGANVAEHIDISANGSRALLTRDVGSITMDLNGIETIALRALGGADTITVNDLTGTNVSKVAVDLQGSGGGGDGAADTVIVNGSAGSDHISFSQNGSQLVVSG